MIAAQTLLDSSATLPAAGGALQPCPVLMTEGKWIHVLRIEEIGTAGNYRHVIEKLNRRHGLPRIRLCGKTVYLTHSVTQWLQRQVTCRN